MEKYISSLPLLEYCRDSVHVNESDIDILYALNLFILIFALTLLPQYVIPPASATFTPQRCMELSNIMPTISHER